MVLLNAAQIISYYIRYGEPNRLEGPQQQAIFLVSNLVWVSLILYFDSYKIIRVERIETTLLRTIKLVFAHMGVIALFIVVLKYADISRLRVLFFYIGFFLLLLVFRIVFMRILKYARKQGYNFKQVIIVGANETGLHMAKILSADLSYGYRVIGFADDKVDPAFEKMTPLISNLQNIEAYVAKHKVDEMYIALHINEASEITRLIKLCERYMIRIKFIPDFQQYTKTRKVVIDFYENTPVLMIRKEPLELAINRLSKKFFDICFSILVILLIFPWLFPILMIIIKIGSKGPIFFRQERSGEDNKSFYCLKFRTMRVNKLSDELQAKENDPRITKIGAIMRKTNLDELPQFFNVLWGKMSVVGPRPHMLKHTEQYSELINNYLVRHYAKPGITGWAQVNGFRGETKELIDMQKRVEFDIWYIENWSFLLDLKIIWLTVWNMLRGEKNAY
jgi:undecaprenyl-phosphate galactose phosphotransferase/putative colanic acid biosynthesis UDP-glucose lipid carrier transferase